MRSSVSNETETECREKHMMEGVGCEAHEDVALRDAVFFFADDGSSELSIVVSWGGGLLLYLLIY